LWNGEAFIDKVIPIPRMLVADETEEVIDDPAIGGGELDLVAVGTHEETLADGSRGDHISKRLFSLSPRFLNVVRPADSNPRRRVENFESNSPVTRRVARSLGRPFNRPTFMAWLPDGRPRAANRFIYPGSADRSEPCAALRLSVSGIHDNPQEKHCIRGAVMDGGQERAIHGKGRRHARHANTCARGRGGVRAFFVDFDKRLLLHLTDVQAIATEPRGAHHAAQITASCVECLSHANRLERFI